MALPEDVGQDAVCDGGAEEDASELEAALTDHLVLLNIVELVNMEGILNLC